MSSSASQIEREVEASRANVEDTVEALKDKMSIGQMVDEAARYFGNTGGSDMVSNLGAQVRDNPLPLVLIGAGIAWLISGRGMPHVRSASRSDYDYRPGVADRDYGLDEDYGYRPGVRSSSSSSSVYSGASHPDYASRSYTAEGSYPSPRGSRSMMDRAGGLAEGASDVMGDVGSAAGRAMHGMRDAAGNLIEGAGDMMEDAGDAAGRTLHDMRDAAGNLVDAAGNIISGIASAASTVASAASRVGRTAYSAAGAVAGGARTGADVAWRGGETAYRGASRAGSGAYRGASWVGSGAYQGASWAGSGMYDGASQLSHRARRSVSEILDMEPLVLGAVGLAVGAAMGAMLPRTDAEDRYMGETRDRLRDEAEDFAREKFEQGKTVASEAYRTAKEEAEAQGLTTFDDDSIVGKVGQVARATLDKVRSTAEEQGLTNVGGTDSDEDAYASDRTTPAPSYTSTGPGSSYTSSTSTGFESSSADDEETTQTSWQDRKSTI